MTGGRKEATGEGLPGVARAAAKTSRTLTALLEREAAAVLSGRFAELEALQPQKRALLAELVRQADVLGAAGPDAVPGATGGWGLIDSVRGVAAAADSASAALRAMIVAVERLTRIITLARRDGEWRGYGREGRTRPVQVGGSAIDDHA